MIYSGNIKLFLYVSHIEFDTVTITLFIYFYMTLTAVPYDIFSFINNTMFLFLSNDWYHHTVIKRLGPFYFYIDIYLANKKI